MTYLDKAGAILGRYRSPDLLAPVGTLYRADHFPFARMGVPAITYGFGQDLVQGGRARGAAWTADYFKNRYHQPNDRWSPDLNLDSVEPDLDLLYAAAREVANLTERPSWCPGSEFAIPRTISPAGSR